MSRSGLGQRLAASIEKNWYGSATGNFWLLPLWALFALISQLRRLWYRLNPARSEGPPVIVVGNISVGGTGKTPLISYLALRASQLGFNTAVVSRGYGGLADQYPLAVTVDTDPQACGDEPAMLARQGLTVVVDPQRARAVRSLTGKVDFILSDDGLQHYAMARAAEILVSDAKRGFGNGWLLPVGPLREPVSRATQTDLHLVNGRDYQVVPVAFVHCHSGEQRPTGHFAGQKVHGVAGIGHPQRFFGTLAALDAQVTEHPFADHHNFLPADLMMAGDDPVIMTEKDWVKCASFGPDALTHCWYLKIAAVPTDSAAQAIDELLQRSGKHHG